MSRKFAAFLKRLICMLLCLASAGLTTYRVKLWLTHYTRLASKMIISAYDEQQQHAIPFPHITICNMNPARGLLLYNPHAATSLGRTSLYELFTDAFQGRVPSEGPRNQLEASMYSVMDKAAHRLTDMLKQCSIRHKRCSAKNFTRIILPTGACYTYNGKTQGLDEIQLTLNPQAYDYLIPNQGFVGFRVMLHDSAEPLWANMPSAIYAGPTFHTTLRAVGLKKVYKHNCLTNRAWAHCMHDCMQQTIRARCQCSIQDCTLSQMMHCGIKMYSLMEIIDPSLCKCRTPCHQLTYSVESVTQALKSPLFSTQPVADHIQSPADQSTVDSPANLIQTVRNEKTQIWDGSQLQTWAFLREANRSAFMQLRNLASTLGDLHANLRNVEKLINFAPLDSSNLISSNWKDIAVSQKLTGLCMDPEEHRRSLNRVRHLGQDFVRSFRKSVLFRDFNRIPGNDFHIHLTRLFFSPIRNELDALASHLQHNDLFSDVTMLDLQQKASHCKENVHASNISRADRNELVNHSHSNSESDVASLQNVLLSVDSQFKQFRLSFSQLLDENHEIIDALSMDELHTNLGATKHESLVTLTVQLTRDKNRLVRLESAQLIYNPFTELVDMIISGLVLAFLAVFLFDLCFTRSHLSAVCCCEDSVRSRKNSINEEPVPPKSPCRNQSAIDRSMNARTPPALLFTNHPVDSQREAAFRPCSCCSLNGPQSRFITKVNLDHERFDWGSRQDLYSIIPNCSATHQSTDTAQGPRSENCAALEFDIVNPDPRFGAQLIGLNEASSTGGISTGNPFCYTVSQIPLHECDVGRSPQTLANRCLINPRLHNHLSIVCDATNMTVQSDSTANQSGLSAVESGNSLISFADRPPHGLSSTFTRSPPSNSTLCDNV